MWCKHCNIETNEDICPICGHETTEDLPVEIFWCKECKIPIIHFNDFPPKYSETSIRSFEGNLLKSFEINKPKISIIAKCISIVIQAEEPLFRITKLGI